MTKTEPADTTDADPPSKAWVVSIDGKQFHVYDFSIEELDELAADHDCSWAHVLSFPLRTLALSSAVVRKGAEKLGVEPPDINARNILDFLERVDDDDPVEVEVTPTSRGPKRGSTRR